MHDSKASMPFSRPIPLSFMPPLHSLVRKGVRKKEYHGLEGSFRWAVLTQQRPDCISAATACARDRFCVHTLAPRPYLLSFAKATASLSVYRQDKN